MKNKKYLPLVIITTLVLIIWIPIIWKDDLDFDKALFANSYFSFLLELFKLLITFLVGKLFLEHFFEDRNLRIYEGWLISLQSDICALENNLLEKICQNSELIRNINNTNELIKAFLLIYRDKYSSVLFSNNLSFSLNYEIRVDPLIKKIVNSERSIGPDNVNTHPVFTQYIPELKKILESSIDSSNY